jgi:hypothetical protein
LRGYDSPMTKHQPQGKSLRMMNSALESTLGVGTLTLVLVGCGGGWGRRVLCRRKEVRLLFVRSHYDDERRLGWDPQSVSSERRGGA